MATPVPPSTTPTPPEFRPPMPSADLYEPDNYADMFEKHKSHKAVSKFSDPCHRASKASLKCLEMTHYNKSECYHYFKAYRECKEKWLAQKKKDQKEGKSK